MVNSEADPGNGIKGTHMSPPPLPVLDLRYTASFKPQYNIYIYIYIDIIFCIMQLLLSNFFQNLSLSIKMPKRSGGGGGACPHTPLGGVKFTKVICQPFSRFLDLLINKCLV